MRPSPRTPPIWNSQRQSPSRQTSETFRTMLVRKAGITPAGVVRRGCAGRARVPPLRAESTGSSSTGSPSLNTQSTAGNSTSATAHSSQANTPRARALHASDRPLILPALVGAARGSEPQWGVGLGSALVDRPHSRPSRRRRSAHSEWKSRNTGTKQYAAASKSRSGSRTIFED